MHNQTYEKHGTEQLECTSHKGIVSFNERKNSGDDKKDLMLFTTNFMRLMSMIFHFYPYMFIGILLTILTSAVISALPPIFMQQILAVIAKYWQSGDWHAAIPYISSSIITLICVYVCALASTTIGTQLCAVFTESTINKLRKLMFSHMDSLPLSYFDKRSHGDIMSMYTNDVDALRQMLSQSLPNVAMTLVTMVTLTAVMLYYSASLMVVVILGVACTAAVTKIVGKKSAGYFLAQQNETGNVEGFAQEYMNGLKEIKVFTHEAQSLEAFDQANEKLFVVSHKANLTANMLPPLIFNIGNLAYVMVALAGGICLLYNLPNVSLSGMALSLAVVIPFLNITKQFVGQIAQISHQINSIVMGFAGVSRIFHLLDELPEQDEGYVTLVNVEKACDAKGQSCVHEVDTCTNLWAWKHPHTASQEVTYTPLRGDVLLKNLDFAYEPNRLILHDISIHAQPGYKIALVGATGAGKTTITNLLNRFYEVADGKIHYDGINLTKIKKRDLRKSLGIVLQDVNLFTGTVIDNIRYGRLDASDEECMQAAHLSGADTFIERLPDGYETRITDNGSNLSQGQRQLLAIARAAVANPPVMILDEATSSIDTHTEELVQKGMDALMRGRTTFVIAHRLSTVRNADEIVVLDHGRIVERGSHDELLLAKGVYYQLYTGAFELE